jgi:protein SCO1/2
MKHERLSLPLRRWVRGNRLRCCAGGLLLILAWVLPAFAQPEQTQDAILREIGIDQHLNEQIPLDLTFRDEAGQSVQLGRYFGKKPVILALVYYQCPMLCTLTLNGLVSALKAVSFDIGNQFNVVTVSFNPAETPSLAAAKRETYLKSYGRVGADAGWHFLTGDDANIKRLVDAVGFRYRYVPEQKQFAHAAGITLLTPSGKIARYFFGVEYAPRDLRLGLVEASQERIGSPVDELLLYCFHYDPATGKYGAVVMNIVRLGGAVTVLVLGGALLVMWRRDRRPHAPVEVTR